ncbi:MAG: Modification methylase DpnIIB [Alphaproteobacteria bacterium MarineAlpha2_Bin1]|nr:MAG: Modification methylase DpnIIB [Alphaproteobacteria bacterium MarineAlpha2_Bin1]|tara:strand:- start:256 stop:1359 length:1104 start_codon:yes stop_codon:yes gene_type:complete
MHKLKINNFLNRIIPGNSLDILRDIPDESIDLIFADPPYNLQISNKLTRPNNSLVKGVSEEWDKFDSFDDYDKFTIQWLTQAKRILKSDGTIWVIGSYHNIFRIGSKLQDLGFWLLNDIIWIKSNPMPNFRGRRFTNAHETLIWSSKNKNNKSYNFNYDAMKSLNDDIQMRSDWILPICRGSERIKINGEKAHSTQKPEALLSRVILASSKVGDIVLDPFSGSGTTASVAKKLDRKFIGIEKDLNYVMVSKQRINSISSYDSEALILTESKKSKPRIPFGQIIERGLLKPGAILFDNKKKYFAKIRADGSLITVPPNKSISGSIHKVGASVLGSSSCNGWDFWHYYNNKKIVPLDFFREKLRKEKNK